ncbi:MAG: hypothetical protein EZS28_028116 [Streblomastix strix]|uniref:Uncharacterized protein n=1 Tax=Streblomastix strix TaxID=222440 RepID=A0A5J4V0Y3_9EUKA|nr:MAG: hypothetical protein EZS28_028116 [Streblomastix strix]
MIETILKEVMWVVLMQNSMMMQMTVFKEKEVINEVDFEYWNCDPFDQSAQLPENEERVSFSEGSCELGDVLELIKLVFIEPLY